MSKNPELPVRTLSVLIGVGVGCILSYAYQVNMPTLSYERPLWDSFVIFASIPVLAGFVGGLLHPASALKNGLYIGFFSGVFNSILATVKMILIYTPGVALNEVYGFGVYSFCVFAVISIFIWMILAAAAGVLAEKFYE